MPRPPTETVELSTRTLDDLEDLLTDPRGEMPFERRMAIHERLQRQRE
jgi:hypothetical protein